MILLAALLCNYGRGKCLIIIGTEGYRGVSSWENAGKDTRALPSTNAVKDFLNNI
jgi:hypothetical protein